MSMIDTEEYNRQLALKQIELQKRKKEDRKKRLAFVRDFIIAIIIGFIVGWLTGCQNAPEQSVSTAIIEQTSSADADGTATSDDVKDEPGSEPIHETPTATGSWHDATRPHDISVNSILKYDDNAIFNFNNTVAVGVSGKFGIITPAETESGFILSVIDNDSVKVTFYNNGTDYIIPVKLTAEMPAEDYVNETGVTEYIIDGYSACGNGFGLIEMALSNGKVARAGILRENNKLYAANFTTNPATAENSVNFRLKMESVLTKNNIRPDNSTYTDPIYYPIVPVTDNERTDVEFWVSKANELAEDNWTDAHKVMAFYNYIINNLAYDDWIVSRGGYHRIYCYNDFTGKYFTSRTRVGVCEDFANILAIMCRAQNIPATKIFTDKHAWDYVYIADYGRWLCIDATNDLQYNCYSEDSSKWSASGYQCYANFDAVTPEKLSSDCFVCIGNNADMERYNIIPVESQ